MKRMCARIELYFDDRLHGLWQHLFSTFNLLVVSRCDPFNMSKTIEINLFENPGARTPGVEGCRFALDNIFNLPSDRFRSNKTDY